MLSAKQMEFNKTKFQEINKTYNIFTKELEDFLGDDFYMSPSSSTLDMYGCYPGGLLHILLRASKYSIEVNELLPDELKQDKGSIVKTMFLSQIGKVRMFKPNTNNWQVTNLGKVYEFTESDIKLRVGERSLFLLNKYGVKVFEDELQGILNMDKDGDGKMEKYFSSTLSQIIKIGTDLAIMEDKKWKKKT